MKRLAILALLSVAACKIPIGEVPCDEDTQCAAGQICGSDGVCETAPVCTNGERLCGHTCTDVTTTSNCGGCGVVCSSGMLCIAGTCAIDVGTAVITAPAYADQGATGLTATVTSSDPTATYTWTISGGTFADGTAQASGAQIHFNAGTGAFVSLQATGSNTAGEQEQAKATVNLVPPLPASIAITTARVVSANAANINAQVTAIANATFAWTINNGTLAQSAGTSVAYTAGASGQVTLSVTATSISGSTSNGQAIVQIAPEPGTLNISTVSTAQVGQGGLVASVAAQAGVTLAWSITGGTFGTTNTPASSAVGSSVSYTAGLGPAVVLTCTSTNGAGATETGNATVPVTIGTTGTLTAVGGANQVSLRWDGVSGATKYHVLRSSTASGAPAELLDSTTTNALDSSLPNGKRYYYQIEAATDFIDGAPSATQSAVTNLPAPTNLTAMNGSSIVLAWAAVPDATSYSVFRKTGTANFTAIGTSTTTGYTDSSGLTGGGSYSYMVHAVTADAESTDSNIATAFTTLDAPLNLTASVAVYNVTLNWTPNPAATGYDILRSTSPDSGFAVIDSTSSATYCNCANTAAPPAPATTYYYEVRSTTGATASAVSNVASATTAFPPPTNLSYQIENRNTVVLTWDPVAGATEYSVQRATSPNGPFSEISETSNTTYTDAGLPYGTQFYYQIVVISSAGPSMPSQVVSLVTGASPYKQGTGVFGGEVQSVIFDPSNPTTAWAGVQGGAGIYRSNNSGATWTASGIGLGANSVHSLAFSQGTLFAGTRGAGVYSLAQGGTSWIAANSGLVATDTYPSLVADPGNSGAIYAASYSAVYRSANNGSTWTATSFTPAAPVTALAIHPTDPTTLYAATDGSGVFVTHDSGNTWTALGPSSAGVQGGILIDPNTPANIWIGTTAGVFASSDGGNTWNAVGSLSLVRSLILTGGALFASTSNGGIQMSVGQGGFTSPGGMAAVTTGVTAMASSGSTLLAASYNGVGVFVSSDSGSTWNASDTGLTAASAPAVAISKSAPTNLYGVAGYSLVKSVDRGSTWTSAMGSGVTYPVITSAVAIDPTTPSTVYVGAQGVLRSTDAGATWVSTNANFTPMALALSSSTTAYAAVYGAGVYKSVNINAASPTWTLANTGLDAQGLRTVAVAPSAAAQVYAGGDHGVWSSSNGGTNWTAPAQQLQYVRSLAVHPTISTTVYAVVTGGVSGSQLRESVDGGATWTDLSFGSTAVQNLTSIQIDPTNPSILFALGTSANGSVGGLYKSTNGGAAWVDVSAGLGSRQLRNLVLDPAISGNVYIASDDSGLLVTTSGGL